MCPIGEFSFSQTLLMHLLLLKIPPLNAENFLKSRHTNSMLSYHENWDYSNVDWLCKFRNYAFSYDSIALLQGSILKIEQGLMWKNRKLIGHESCFQEIKLSNENLIKRIHYTLSDSPAKSHSKNTEYPMLIFSVTDTSRNHGRRTMEMKKKIASTLFEGLLHLYRNINQLVPAKQVQINNKWKGQTLKRFLDRIKCI